MRVKEEGKSFFETVGVLGAPVIGLLFCLGFAATVIGDEADQRAPQDIHACCPASPYGDGSDGDVVLTQDTQLTQNMSYRTLTVSSGVTLDLRGHIIRVCEKLINWGTITDTTCGGQGGNGGDRGRGASPCGHVSGKPEYPEPGDPGNPGGQPVCDGGGEGGDGGGGGGGGGGAKYQAVTYCAEAYGGNGGDGGDGGRGGGVVKIFAFQLENHGVIHADGEDGQDGQNGQDGEYFYWALKDLAGGGGGSGCGGDGGDGGTVEVNYAVMLSMGTLRGQGGDGGEGRNGGAGHPCEYTTVGATRQFGQPGGGCGGDGGNGEYRIGYSSEPGEAGGDGSDGADGDVLIIHLTDADDCNENGIWDYCDLTECPSGEAWCDDCQSNGVPDVCDIDPTDPDGDGIVYHDWDENGIPDDPCECIGMDCCPLLPDGPVCYGDGNGDGIVSPQDVGLAKYYYGSTEDEALCRYDVNCDGTIDPVDVGLIKYYYGPCTAESPPPCYMVPD